MKIGMSATVALAGDVVTQHVIPLSAVLAPYGAPPKSAYVWALRENNTVYSVPVTLGAPVGGNEVQVSGLESGLRIVTAGVTRLRDGESVSVLDPSAIGGSLAAGVSRVPSGGPRSGATVSAPVALPTAVELP